ncbi:uncharacterized protein BT62DRAFT_372188 [Guyanagaster necrorhizus]|uniref:Uncharacterized protein n=1 Tax=Guyanagaster necrorhizus TaxID=856835 RepID=A0A9P7VLW3_9AGAR|nr:uncharacterized protein BT62DRAFT_372188 [Guyanagaster necrorhizus MCA 3950]KAG7442740.1 hypothetical protein BT62DRAFT_372188 [Guyanagaster necrorhizus MCA 3950]
MKIPRSPMKRRVRDDDDESKKETSSYKVQNRYKIEQRNKKKSPNAKVDEMRGERNQKSLSESQSTKSKRDETKHRKLKNEIEYNAKVPRAKHTLRRRHTRRSTPTVTRARVIISGCSCTVNC